MPELHLLAAAVDDFEREFGEISAEEMAAQRRADRRSATVVRGPKPRAGDTSN